MRLLSLVPTPIGNLADVTLRALEVLRGADVIAAEDTRHSRTLLEHHGIDRPLLRLDAHTIAERGPGVLERYERVALITDAGTPGISDPGAELVRIALASDVKVEVLPGPTAFVPALVLSGLPTARFTFEGFLPRKGASRKLRMQAIAVTDATTVLYESAQRLAATLADLRAFCGAERRASVSRELSKLHEETVRGSLDALAARYASGPTRGEVVVVVEGARDAPEPGAMEATAGALAEAGIAGRPLQRALVALGASRNEAYELSLRHAAEDDEA